MARRHADTGSFTVLDEDFQPKSEEKEKEGAHLLLVYLPDFSKDQIRVTYVHSVRSVRVEGERSLGNNKWSRFNRTFSVSQNCIVEKIQAAFEDGILTITIPKQTTSPPQPTASFSNGEGVWFQPPAVERSHMNISPITESKAQKGPVQTDTSAKETLKQSIQSDDGNTKGEQKRIDASTPSKAPNEPILQKQDEPPLVKGTEKTKEMKNVAAAAKKTTLEEEDRQLIVDMGVAVLMIIAVGAYVTYITRSSTNAME